MKDSAQASSAQTKEATIHSTNIRQIKAALVDQAFLRSARVSCAIGVVAVRRRKGQFLAMISGWGMRWYPVECVLIEYAGLSTPLVMAEPEEPIEGYRTCAATVALSTPADRVTRAVGS